MFRQLLVPLDGSTLAEQALPIAARLAQESGGRVDIVMVHRAGVIPEDSASDAVTQQLTSEDDYLERTAFDLSTSFTIPTTHAWFRGDAAQTIAARATDINADLIVLTSHGRTGFRRAWLGSVADELIRTTDKPVLLLRSQSRKTDRIGSPELFERVLVLHDGSDASRQILPAVNSLCSCADSTVVLLRVVQPLPLATAPIGVPAGALDVGIPAAFAVVEDIAATEQSRSLAEKDLEGVAANLRQSGLKKVETHVVVDDSVATRVADFAAQNNIDAVAMCTHGRGASRLLYGSIADKILRDTHLPILVLRPAL